jgi:SAM-dependent methyltransferase
MLRRLVKEACLHSLVPLIQRAAAMIDSPVQPPAPSPVAQASHGTPPVEKWEDSQSYELSFWRNTWPFRHIPREELVAQVRNQDAHWFLRSFQFSPETSHRFSGFSGKVLEVGCGPIGFFESIEGVQVLGIDTLMALYAEHLPFSRLGPVGNYVYSPQRVEDVQEQFDFVVCSNVLDHTSDWRSFLNACLRRVKPGGGQLLLYTHCRNAPSPGHTQVFGPQDLIGHLLKNGVRSISQARVRPDVSAHADFECYVRCDAPVMTG